MAILLHVFSFPPFGIGWNIFICLVPLLIILDGKSKSKYFLFFFLFSFISYLVLLFWVPRVIVKYGNASTVIGIIAVIALSLFLSIFTGICGVFIGSMTRRTFLLSIWLVAAIWICKDLVIENIFSGFPWCSFGYSQWENISFCQWAEFGGIHLITFLVVGFNYFIYFLWKRKSKKLLIVAFAIFSFFQFGGHFLKIHHQTEITPIPFHIAGIIQPNVNHDISFTFNSAQAKLEKLFQQSILLKNKSCEFVVWPEYSVPFYPLQDPVVLRRIFSFTKSNIPIFAGFTDFQNNKSIFNSIILFKKGTFQKYDKIHLAPFGEYIPFRKILFFVKRITDEIGDYSPGKTIFNLSLNKHLHATPICYEIIYPELVRSFIQKKAEVIITISNDSWFGKTSAPYQHLSMAVFRAIENRRYILRSTSNGISALISSTGNILRKSPIGKEDFFAISFQYITKKTLFTKYGYLFPYFCVIAIIGFYVKTRLWNNSNF